LDQEIMIITLSDALRDIVATASSVRINGLEDGETIEAVLTEIEQTSARALTHCGIEVI